MATTDTYTLPWKKPDPLLSAQQGPLPPSYPPGFKPVAMASQAGEQPLDPLATETPPPTVDSTPALPPLPPATTGGSGGYVPHDTLGGDGYAGSTNIHPTDYNTAAFQKFSDATYADMARQLDPMYASQEKAFQQQMVNQGLQPGTEAYDAAFANFSRSRNDAYDQARRSALGAALAAQNQSFQQGASQAQINAAIRQAQIAAGAQRYGADISLQNTQANNQGEMARLLESLGFNREQLAGQMELGRGNLGVSQRGMGLAENQADFGNLMQLFGMQNQNTQYNNSLLNSDFSRGAGLLGLIPGVTPSRVDTTGAYGIQQQGYQNQLAASNAQNQQSQQTWGDIASLAGTVAMLAFLSSRELKEPIGSVDVQLMLDKIATLPVDHWTYKGGHQVHIGTYAEPFNQMLGKPSWPAIEAVDMCGVLLAGVQALVQRNKDLSERVRALEERGE
jgi:hypothetical protein